MPKRKKKEKLDFPLLNLLSGEDLLRQYKSATVPDFIKFNLKHKLRGYQKSALENLIIAYKEKRLNHLLFNMATGSGKTDLMAAIILLMYKFGYQEFLFTVNTNAVLAKTRENLINSTSLKYLFKQSITIDGERIEIQEVNNFPLNKERGVIYIKLATIQTLTNELNSPVENGMTEVDLKKHELIILADEAHHLSASTKNKKKRGKKDNEIISWENTINTILDANKNNQLFEFTATVNWNDDSLYAKYKNKLVYKYDLGQFIQDGYSKNVYRLQANSDDETKMLNAVILNQYRKYIAKDHGIVDFKPVILFKSNKIDTSKKENEKFINLIEKLDADYLKEFIITQIESNKSNALKLAYGYFQNHDLGALVTEIKQDFDKRNVINVNVKASEDILDDIVNFQRLNSLEDVDNPCRAIFAVAKLNEGWDVLNLYDIVLLGENKATKTQTDQEAQLIGRGARYYPFMYNNKKSYTRRFDNSNDDELQLLENLYYHTMNDSKYLSNLKKSLDELQISMREDTDQDIKVYTANLKPSFKKSNVYKHGVLYYNEVKEVPADDFDELSKYGIDTENIYSVDLTKSTWETNYDSEVINESGQVKSIRISEIGKDSGKDSRLLRKAISRNIFFRFNKLKQYLPTLTSMNEFMFDKKWLGNVRLDAQVDEERDSLSVNDKLQAVERYLSYVQSKIVKNFKRHKGTNKFKPIKISEVLSDYSKKVPQAFNTIEMIVEPHKIKEDWFAYDYAIVDKLEKGLIDLIRNFVDQLTDKYENVYLFRIDEQNTNFKLHDFGEEVTHFAGFMPDFILYLEDKESIYQLYVEPKGEQLIERDKWKEQLLEKISPDRIELVGENNNVNLYGVKFYRSGDINDIEDEIKNKVDLVGEDNKWKTDFLY